METFLQGLAREIGVDYLPYENYCNKNSQRKEIDMLRVADKRKELLCAGTLDVNTAEAMTQVLEAGYRYFDLATAYKDAHLALAVAMEKYDRNDLHICTKINDGDLLRHHFSVRKILDEILHDLRTAYVDTLMLHSPALLLHEHAAEVMEELIALKKQGLIRRIGVSNFTIADLERLDEQYRRHIDYNQIELSPYCQQTEVVEYCRKNNIQVMAYRPFGKGKGDMLQDGVLCAIAAKHSATVHQVILAWIMQQNMVAIPKAGSRSHLDDNLKACRIKLEPVDMQAIAAFARTKNVQTCSWEKFVKLPDIGKYKNVCVTKPLTGRFGTFAPVVSEDTNKPGSDLARLAAKI